MKSDLLLRLLFLSFCAVVAFTPSKKEEPSTGLSLASLEDWPQQIIGPDLQPVERTAQEARFNGAFPGKIEEYTSRGKHYLFRGVSQPTRQLHLSADCLRGSGYHLSPTKVVEDEKGIDWVTYRATRGAENLRVRERLVDRYGNGWTDISAWYWNAILNQTEGPWIAVTEVSPFEGEGD